MIKRHLFASAEWIRLRKRFPKPNNQSVFFPHISICGAYYIPGYNWGSHIPEEKKGKITDAGHIEYQTFLPQYIIHRTGHILVRNDEPPDIKLSRES